MQALDTRITEIGADFLRGTQVWGIRIENAAGDASCVARLTTAVAPGDAFALRRQRSASHPMRPAASRLQGIPALQSPAWILRS